MTQDAKAAKAEAIKVRSEAMAAKELKLNEGKTGVGLRTFVAMTRGKTPTEVQYDAFDVEKPDTLPKNPQAFLEIVGEKTDEELVSLLIEGYNEQAYTSASDPIAEYVDDSWDKETKARFRLVVRNYSAEADATIEEAVQLVKPGFAKGVAKKLAATAAK